MTFGERIKNLRIQRKLSQQYVADRLGISQTALSSYEINRTEPSFATIKMFAEYFGVSPISLLPFESDSNEAKLYEMADTMSRNPKLRVLFDRSKYLPDSSLDAVLAVITAISKEREDGQN